MQMPLRGEGWFRPSYEFLVGLYPGHRSDEQEFESYETILKPFPTEAVREVAARAPSLWPGTWFPSAGQIQAEVERVLQARRAAQAKRPEPSKGHRRTTPAARRLIDEWAEEDRHRTMRPDGTTPREIGTRRLREIVALMGDNDIGRGFGRAIRHLTGDKELHDADV